MQLRYALLALFFIYSQTNTADDNDGKLSKREIEDVQALCFAWDHWKTYGQKSNAIEIKKKKTEKVITEQKSAQKDMVPTWEQMAESGIWVGNFSGPTGYISDEQFIDKAQEYISYCQDESMAGAIRQERLKVVGYFLVKERKIKGGDSEEDLKWMSELSPTNPISEVHTYHENKTALLLQYLSTGDQACLDKADLLHKGDVDGSFISYAFTLEQKIEFKKLVKEAEIPLRHLRAVSEMILFDKKKSQAIHDADDSLRSLASARWDPFLMRGWGHIGLSEDLERSATNRQAWVSGRLFAALKTGNLSLLDMLQ